MHRGVGEPSEQHRDFQRLGMRIGQALAIAVFKALRMQKQMTFFGHFKNLDAHDDSTLYQKEEPPQVVSTNAMPGDRSLDVLVSVPAAGLAGIEVKNIREWVIRLVKHYPAAAAVGQ